MRLSHQLLLLPVALLFIVAINMAVWRGGEEIQVGVGRSATGVHTPQPLVGAITAEVGVPLFGRSSVIDGDTLEVGGQRIRLEGIDAPESSQRCGADDDTWRCGQRAALALSDWLGVRTVTCHPTGKDRYGRTLARCWVDDQDIQAWMVLHGWALAYRAYSMDYVEHEAQAQQERAGMWRGPFTAPWDWRRQQRRR